MIARVDELQCGSVVLKGNSYKKLTALYFIKYSLNQTVDISILSEVKILLVYQTVNQPVQTLINKLPSTGKNDKYSCAYSNDIQILKTNKYMPKYIYNMDYRYVPRVTLFLRFPYSHG